MVITFGPDTSLLADTFIHAYNQSRHIRDKSICGTQTESEIEIAVKCIRRLIFHEDIYVHTM